MQQYFATAVYAAIFYLGAALNGANANTLTFKCVETEICGTLSETGCWEEDKAFVLNFDSTKGFSANLHGETWASTSVVNDERSPDLTSVVMVGQTGEVAIMTTNPSWQFTLSIHYTGAGNKLNWYAAKGYCEVAN